MAPDKKKPRTIEELQGSVAKGGNNSLNSEELTRLGKHQADAHRDNMTPKGQANLKKELDGDPENEAIDGMLFGLTGGYNSETVRTGLQRLLNGLKGDDPEYAKTIIQEQMQVLSVLTFDACNIIYDELEGFAENHDVKEAFKEEVGKAVIKLTCRDIMDVCTSAASLNGLMGEADKRQMQTLSEAMKAIIDNLKQSNEDLAKQVKDKLTQMRELVEAVETKATTGANKTTAEKCTILINVLTAALKVVTTLGMNPDAKKEFTTAKNSWDEIGKNEKLKNQAKEVKGTMNIAYNNMTEAKSLSPNTNPTQRPTPPGR